jgi:hypothetical protein
MFLTTDGAPPTAALAFEIDIYMTDAFEAQGEFAPVQSEFTNTEFTAAVDTVSERRSSRRSTQPPPRPPRSNRNPACPTASSAGPRARTDRRRGRPGLHPADRRAGQGHPARHGQPARTARPLHRPDGLQPDRQRQDRGLPAARAAHPAEAPGRSRRARSQGRVPAPGRRSRRPRRSAAQEGEAQGPDQHRATSRPPRPAP